MSKIFGFIGSPFKEKSNTYTLTQKLIEALRAEFPGLYAEIYTAGMVKLNYCKGCWCCMKNGFCPQDKEDDMGMLKAKMLEADLVIFGSPVYTYAVSGQTKVFLDRLAAWYHTLRLAGKPALTVATTAGGGAEQVHHLLSLLLSALGAFPLTRLDLDACYTCYIDRPERIDPLTAKAVKHILPYLTGEKQPESTPQIESAFAVMREKSLGAKEYLPADYHYWEEHGMLNVTTYAQLLKKIRSEKAAR